MPSAGLIGQGWLQVGELCLAFMLSALIGLEREVRHKSAGLRTYTLIGFAAALIMLVSKYGFSDILSPNEVVLDPSRVAAQIVTGVGFIGGGLIFVRRDSVRGLTTATTVWVTAAIGMACGAGLPILALIVTAGHFVVVFGFPYLVRRLPKSRWTPSGLRVAYEDGRGILRDILVICTKGDFAVSRLWVDRGPNPVPSSEETDETELDMPEISETAPGQRRIVSVLLEIQGTRSVAKLAARLMEIDGVVSVNAADVNLPSD